MWFDVDARIYRRERDGEFALFARLPGTEIQLGTQRITGVAFETDSTLVRMASLPPSSNFGVSREGVVVPVWSTDSVQWLLVLAGNVPPDAELTLSILSRVLGAQMERLGLRRTADMRLEFEGIVAQAARVTELTALDLMRQLLRLTDARAAALWVRKNGELRRLAGIGTEQQGPAAFLNYDQHSTPTRHVRTLSLGGNATAHIDLRATDDAPFSPVVEEAVEACAAVLKVWLAGTDSPPHAALFEDERVHGFLHRIEEELARARRFERRLALVLVQANGADERGNLQDLTPLLRQELRGSDVLGMLGRDRIVALLVETDSNVVSTVVRRLRDRIGRAMSVQHLPGLAVGEAAYSPECPTVQALLSRAEVNARTITQTV